MDYYANDSLGSWTVNNEKNRPPRNLRKPKTTTVRSGNHQKIKIEYEIT